VGPPIVASDGTPEVKVIVWGDAPGPVSTSVCELPLEYSPTATQNVEDVHETPARPLNEAEVFGLGVTDQLVPLRVSTRVGLLLPVKLQPTATQKVEETHEMPYRAFSWVLEVFGLGVIDQLVPSRVSTRVCQFPVVPLP
jgi:hypothetical protein